MLKKFAKIAIVLIIAVFTMTSGTISFAVEPFSVVGVGILDKSPIEGIMDFGNSTMVHITFNKQIYDPAQLNNGTKMYVHDFDNYIIINGKSVTDWNNLYSSNVVINVKTNLTHIRLNSFVYAKNNLLLRSYESWDFGYKAIKYINKNIRDANVIYATPWPFLGQYAFLEFNKYKRIPVIMNVQDLYPESLFTKIKSKWIVRVLSFLYRIDKYIAKQSTHITCVSEN